MKALFLLIALSLPFAPAACNRAAVEQTAPSQGQTAQVKREPLELTGVDLHKVRLAAPHKRREQDGTEKVFDQAWLVLLSFRNPPPVTNTALDIFIGDYRIPEYGGFQNGIYFKIYDESLLSSLNGQEISAGVAGKKKQSLGRKFSTEGYAKLAVEEESAVLKRQPQL